MPPARVPPEEKQFGKGHAENSTMLNLTLFTTSLVSMIGAVWWAIKDEATTEP